MKKLPLVRSYASITANEYGSLVILSTFLSSHVERKISIPLL